DSEKYSDRLNKYLANFNFNEEKSVLYFVTVVFIANEGQMALRDPKKLGSWAWFWLVESAQRLGKICLQSKEIGPEMTACVRFSIGSLLLNCASVKDVYAHKYLLKSFSHFQAAIERRIRKGLTRRIDAEIVLNEQSMVAIVNMATCFLELRQMDKCTALICQARLLLGKSTILDELSKHYLSAFIDYFDGVNDFERTSPLHSKLNAGSVILNARELRELYDSALEKLTRSAYRLRQSFSKSTIFASTLTMLGIVTANRTAEFNDTSLAYLQEAVQVEMALSQRSNTMRYLLQTISVAAGLFENDESAIALRWKELHSSVKSLHHNDLSATKEEHPIAVLLRFWSDNWRSARCLMNNSRKLSNELRGAFEASAAWFHLGAVLDSSLAEVCVDLNELLPKRMLRSGQIKRSAKSLSQSLQSWLPKSDNDLSDPVFALVEHRIAILDDALGATNEFMNSSDNSTTVLDLNQDYVNVELLPMPKPKRRLAPFQEAYDSCTSTGLLDTPLHACVHLSTAVILYKSAVKDLTKTAYSQYNAAVLKLRRASRVLELLEPLHPLTGDCYALLAVMYYNMMQLEDQEEKALNCLRACLKIQRNLIANGCATSCWAWRSIDVARKLAVYFATSDRQSEWSGIVTAADAILEMSRDCSVETRSLLLGDDAIWTEIRLGDRFVAERLVDPIIDWEGKQHLRETCEAMFGRVYPEDKPANLH
uniref:Separase n=1 Tax=Macrostomum lignano TaxID=282301 RepID=A0A1I8GG15_9PLAT